MPNLDVCAHLWDGSEAGWKLRRINHQTWRIRIVFSGPKPTTAELQTIRKLRPELRALSVREAVNRLGRSPHYDLPEPVGNIEMRQIMDQAKTLGLEAQANVEDLSSEVPVRDDNVLLIEDDALARQICERMKAAGVAMEFIEVD